VNGDRLSTTQQQQQTRASSMIDDPDDNASYFKFNLSHHGDWVIIGAYGSHTIGKLTCHSFVVAVKFALALSTCLYACML
jgi:hypothetical protein